MNVRAWIPHLNDFYYPDNDRPEAMSIFWGVLEGYRKKDLLFSVDYSPYLEDIDGNPVYENDKVLVLKELEVVTGDLSLSIHSNPEEAVPTNLTGFLTYVDGCFILANPAGLYMDIATTLTPEGSYLMKVVGNKYQK